MFYNEIYDTQKALPVGGYGDMKTVKETIAQAIKAHKPQDVLVTWDIDFTLIIPSHPAAQFPSIKKYQHIFDQMMKDLSPLHIELMYNLMGARCSKNHEKSLTEDEIPEIIKELQAQNIKNIALTAAMPGHFGPIEKIESWRFQTLKNFDIDFSESFPHKSLELDKLPSYFNRRPLFFNGLLYTNGEQSETDKGLVLTHFLKEINYQPKMIVLIDDRYKNITDVQKSAHENNIEFLGIHYTKGRTLGCRDITKENFKEYWHPIAKESEELVKAFSNKSKL